MARNDVYLNINALSPADAVVTGQQDMTAATVPELVLGDTPTFNFLFTDNTNVWPSWAGNASYTLTWALSDAVAGDFAPAATTGNATPITGGWSVILPLNSYDLVGLLNTKRVGQPYPVQNLWQQLRVTDPSGNEVTRAMFWTPVRYRAISDTQNTESASPTGGRFVTVNNVNTLTTPTAAQFYAANPVPTSALGTAANGELLIGNGTGFTKATLTAGSGVSITNGSGSITITATDGDITLDDGTAAAPSLKFTADTDTGLFRPSDNVVGISAGGVSRATFGATSAINGTTIPSSKTLVVTTDKLSALAATTSAELAGVISDETGSGALVFATSPTLTTPNIGAATGTSFNLTGSGTLGTTLTVNSTTDSSSKDTGAIVTEGGLGVEKSASIGGNLTVSGGTGTIDATSGTASATLNLVGRSSGTAKTASVLANSAGSLVLGAEGAGSSLTIAANTGNTTVAYNLTVSGGTNTFGTANGGTYITTPGTAASTGSLFIQGGNASGSTAGGGVVLYGGSHASAPGWVRVGLAGTSKFAVNTSGLGAGTDVFTVDQAGNLTVSGTGTSSVAGKLAVGTTAVIGNAQFTLKKATNKNLNIDAAAGAVSGISIYAGTDADAYTGLQVDGDKLYLNARSGGNVLIGTTTDGGQKLQVSGTGYISGNTRVGDATGTKLLEIAGSNSVSGAGAALALVAGSTYFGYIGRASYVTSGSRNTNDVGYLADTGLGHYFYTNGGTLALTLDSSQNATFAGNVTASGGTALFQATNANSIVHIKANSDTYNPYIRLEGYNRNIYVGVKDAGADGTFNISTAAALTSPMLSLDPATNGATFAGAIAIGNTVAAAAGVSSTHKVTISIGGTTYYLLATNV